MKNMRTTALVLKTSKGFVAELNSHTCELKFTQDPNKAECFIDPKAAKKWQRDAVQGCDESEAINEVRSATIEEVEITPAPIHTYKLIVEVSQRFDDVDISAREFRGTKRELFRWMLHQGILLDSDSTMERIKGAKGVWQVIEEEGGVFIVETE